MADLVLGLAKSAVEGTLSMAKSAIEEQRKLKNSVQRDLMLISDEFEMMHSFLNVTKERAIDDMVRTLVRQVRDMAFEVEDCIESVVDLENKSSLWRRLLPSFMPAAAPVVALDEAVARIELLKARVEAMEQRNMRYSHIGDSSSKIVVPTQPSVVGNPIELDILDEARDSAKYQSNNPVDLIKLINRTSGVLHVISVWGKAGEVGTVSIIQNAYDKPEIYKNFSCRAWVKLVQPFNPEGFLRSILAQFYTNYCPEQSTSDILTLMKPIKVMAATKLELVKEFLKQVNTQRYLIVLEDVSDMVDLETIRAFLPDNNDGSCIIVQTRQLEVARLCIGHSHEVSELKRFSKDHSVYVFFKKDNEKDEQKTKQKAAHVWLERFRHLRIGREIDLNMFRRMVVPSDYRVVVPSDYREVLFVWGVAGVGKTSIVKDVYCSEVLQSQNFKKFGWVNVSHPFNVKELSWNLLLDLHSESPQNYNKPRVRDPIQKCRDLVHEHRCLVVIDGIESVEEWHMTKDTLEIGHSKSCIIVITNEENVATHCAMQSNSTFNVKVLEVDEVLDLFQKKVHENTGAPFIPTRVTDLTILNKCGGLPKVIVAVADFLRGCGSENWTMLSDRFMYELETNQAFGSLQGLFKWVNSYFRTCPDFLKPCIFYLSIFPVNHNIRRRRLVRRWIAEGYSRDTKESTAEEKTEEFFSKLVKLSMIQLLGSTTAMSFDIRMPLCQVNGFFREYIISRSMDENLVFSLEGHCCINSQRTGQHLAIGSTWDRDRNVLESIDVSRLRSLTVFGEWRSFFISDKMRLLRVLDLEDTSGVRNKDLKQMLKLLPRLKFLSLRRYRYISHLPNSMGHLRQLQSLDIRDTSIIRLPKSIIKLHKLQYIRAGTTERWNYDNSTVESQLAAAGTPLSTCSIGRLELCRCHRIAASLNAGVELSARIGHLMALHTLGVIDISVTRGLAILADLKNLSQLHKLGVSGINKNNSQEFISAISGHGHLESLSLQLDEDNQGCLDSISLRLENLWSLKLYGQVNKLPVWIKQHSNIRKLNLQMTIMLSQEDIDALGNLPNLAILFLYFKVFPDGELQFGKQHFKVFRDGELQFGKQFNQLHLLEIGCSSSLQAVTFCSPGFPNLEALKLHCYSVSSFSFSGLEHLRELKEV